MFIARGMHQITKAPERRHVLAWRTVKPVGVRFPNPSGEVPQPVGRGDLAPTMRAGHRIWVLLVHLAPAGRNVYSTRHAPNNQSPRAATGALCLNHGLDRFNRKHRLKNHDATAPLNA